MESEEWVCLGRARFMWMSEVLLGALPNPTFVPGGTPLKEDAINHRVCAHGGSIGLEDSCVI